MSTVRDISPHHPHPIRGDSHRLLRFPPVSMQLHPLSRRFCATGHLAQLLVIIITFWQRVVKSRPACAVWGQRFSLRRETPLCYVPYGAILSGEFRIGVENAGRRRLAVDQKPIDLTCPRCNHSLMDPSHVLDGHPSIRLTSSFLFEERCVRIFWAGRSPIVESVPEIPAGTHVDFFCPHCHAELARGATCARCGDPMVAMLLREGGSLQVCPRPGCESHILDPA
jgi:predicted RNA-binding Zn-ribbon protein involved in translation (DUF1610 family)